MSRYNIPVAERAAAAQAIQNRVNGVAAVQSARERVETVDEFVARGGVVQVLPNNYGDAFLSEWLTVPHG